MAGLIRREDIASVREKARIEEIVGAHVTLKSAGVGSMKGLCPFHDERTPSFHVRPQLGLWHCFGCDEGGDVISFVQKINHLPFGEAVEHLASVTGVELHYEDDGGPRRPREEPGRRQRLLEVNRTTEQFYAEQLGSPEAGTARRFLAERGFDQAAATQFGVGYAPKGWDNLSRHLRQRGFIEAELTASGVVSAGQRGSYDRFRGRLIWPIRDTTGATVGFGARKLYDDDPGPKYLNTPETPLYKKNHVLYGIDLAKKAIATQRQVVVVEGYTDVMAMHLAGVGTAVATCGTAFGVDHIRVVRRMLGDTADAAAGLMLATGSRGGEVIFTFDGDEAGQKAALRAFGEDQRFASQTFVAISPEGMDPCDLRLERGEAAVRDLVAEREPLFEFAIRSVLRRLDLSTAEGRVQALRAAAPVVARIRDLALRSEYARSLAGWLGMEETSVRRAVTQSQRQGAGGDGGGTPAERDPQRQRQRPGLDPEAAQRTGTRSAPSTDPVARLERQVLEVVLQLPQHITDLGFDDLSPDTFVVPAHRAVHDAIRAGGGLAEYVQVAAAAGGGADGEARAAAAWAERLREASGPPVDGLVTELAVSPLPEDRPGALASYARGVVVALLRMGMTRRIAEARGALQRTAPEDPSYAQQFADLVELENARRALETQG
ncbi:DNA primase [Pseudactinotalea sp. Z1732]|uniref:DNA primase n=1 Tax=Micrococcales TaxID=85006 RepID=UPI003C7C2CBF